MIFHGDGATEWQVAMAKDCLELLALIYPGWNWSVKVYGNEKGGGYHLRLLDFPSNYGFNNPRAHMCHSASEFRAQLIRAGGELLERCGVSRSIAPDPEQPLIGRMEGVPEKFQHEPDVSQLPKIEIETVVAAAEREMRDQPRAQVTEILKP